MRMKKNIAVNSSLSHEFQCQTTFCAIEDTWCKMATVLLSYLHFQCFYETCNIHLSFLLHFMRINPFEMLDTMTIFRQNGPKKGLCDL